MKHSLIKLTSLLITAVLLFGVMAAAPFAVSADGNTLTIKATSNLFEGSQIEITEWTSYENKEKEAYVSVEYTIRATDKYLIGLELDELTWDPAVLEYKESYNKVKSGRVEVLNLFPFAVEQGCGTGTYNTFGDNNGGRIVGNYSQVLEPAEAFGENNTATVAVKAIFKVLNKNAGSTTVNCSVETLSLCDKANEHPYVQYLPVNRKDVNTNAADWAEYGSSVAPIYPKPFIRSRSLTIGVGGEVGIYYYISVKDPSYDKSQLRATFEWGTGSFHKTAENPQLNTKNNKEYFLVRVPAPSMTDTVTFKMWEGDTLLLTNEYSVKNYIIAVSAQRDQLPDVTLNVMRDMLYYGSTTQIQFDYHTDDLASDYITYLFPNEDPSAKNWYVRAEDLPDETNIQELPSSYGLTYNNCSMSVDAQIKIYVYFNVTNADAFANTHAFIGNTELPFTTDSKERKRLTISDFTSDKIFLANNITFRNGNEETEMIFSAAKYFNSVKNKESVAQSLKDVMQTMNNFVNSTTAYISRT